MKNFKFTFLNVAVLFSAVVFSACSKVTQGFTAITHPEGGTKDGDGTGTGDNNGGTTTTTTTLLASVQPEFEITPSDVDFGARTLFSQTDLIVTIKNKGLTRATGFAFSTQGLGVSKQSTTCSTELAVQDTCTVTYRFEPTANANYAGIATVSATNGGIGVIKLKGIGGTGPVGGVPTLVASPISLVFDKTTVGAISDTVVRIQNTGPVAASSFAASPQGRGFSLGASTCGASLASGADCTITVKFSPAGVGVWNGNLSVTALNADSLNIDTKGEGTGGTPGFSVDPSTFAFSALNVGSFQEKTFTITNTGTAAASDITPSILGLGFAVQSHTCSGHVTNVNDTCQVVVRFTPTISGGYAGFLTLNAAGAPTALTQMTGSALATQTPVGVLSLSTQALAFANTATGANRTSVITITNTGTADITSLANAISGTGFTVQSTTCGSTLAIAANCTATIKFAPSYQGTHGGYFTVSGTNVNQVVASLAGTGTSSSTLTLTPSSYDFGSVIVGQTRVVSFVLQNTGSTSSGTLTISSLNATIFPIASTDCGTNLAAGASCQILVNFAPSSGSLYSSQVQVAEASSATVVAGVSGQGTVPALSITPTTYSFSTVMVGGQATQSFTVTNTSTVAATGFNVSVIGSAFSAGTNNCSAYSTNFPAGQNCTVTVKFLPDSGTSFTGFIVASASGRDSVYSSLSGTGGAAANLGMTPATKAFGTVFTSVGDVADFTVTNAGGVTATSVVLTLSDTTNYSAVNGCGSSIVGGASCTISVHYNPTNESVHALTVTVDYFNGAVAKTITSTASGTGRFPPTLGLSPASFDFGTITVGNIKKKRFTLTNTGTGYASSVALTTTDVSFALTANTCGSTLAAGANCTVDIEFAPNRLDTFGADKLNIAYSERATISAPILASDLLGYSTTGRAWTFQGPANGDYREIEYTDANNGYIGGSYGQMKVTDDGGATWRTRQSGLPNYDGIWATSSLDANTLFITTTANNLWKSNNAGFAWEPVPNGTQGYYVYNMDCVSGTSTCSAGAQNGSYFKTTDAGANWSQSAVASSYSTVEETSTPDVGHIYTVGQGMLMASHDGGNFFEPLVGNNPMYDMVGTSNSKAMAVGNYGRVRITDDAGDTWQNEAFLNRVANDENLVALSCINDNTCWAGSDRYPNYYIRRTTDRGAHWTDQIAFNERVYSIAAVNANVVYAVGYNQILKTTDGGANWTNQPVPGYGGDYLNSIDCVSTTTCTIAFYQGGDGGLFKTTDGGTTWEEQAYTHGLGQMSAVGTNVWVVGDYGWIRKSTDSGATWRSIRGPNSSHYYNGYWVSDGAGGSIGWIGSSDGQLYKTTDGGSTWSVNQSVNFSENIGGAYINKIFFTDKNHGWFGVQGRVVRTTDGGANWQVVWFPDAPGGDTNAFKNRGCYDLYFSDNNHGWCVQDRYYDYNTNKYISVILRTADGGVTWNNQSSLPPSEGSNTHQYSQFRGIFFTSNTNGFVYPFYSDQNLGAILKTNDGGDTWTSVNYTDSGNNASCDYTRMMFAPDGNHGWILSCDVIFYTTDGGTTWAQGAKPTYTMRTWRGSYDANNFVGMTIVSPGTGPSYNDIVLVATNRYGAIVRSTNSGTSWTQVNLGDSPSFGHIQYSPSGASAFVTSDNSALMLKSTDAGVSYTPVITNANGCNLQRLASFNNSDLVVGSNNCQNIVYSSSNGGTTWTQLSLPNVPVSNGTQTAIAALNLTSGIGALAMNSGAIYKFTNFGRTVGDYVRNTVEPVTTLHGLEFVDANHGWAVGDSGWVVTTADGGATWATQAAGVTTQHLRAVSFFDTSHGFAVGDNKSIIATTDGGATWAAQTPSATDLPDYRAWHFRDIKMTSATRATASTQYGAIALVTGGSTWSDVTATPPPNQYVEKLRNFDRQTVYGVSSGYSSEGSRFLKTLDGGQTWSNVRVIPADNRGLYNLAFASKTTGWIVGQYGAIYKTTNSGSSWSAQTSNTPYDMWGVASADANTAWAVGDNGTIAYTTNGGTTWSVQTIGGNPAFRSVSAIAGTTTAWAVGQSGAIYKTTDGTTWSSQSSGVGSWLYSVHFINSTTGWAVGQSSVVLRTVNGGTTWVSQSLNVNPSTGGQNFNDVYAVNDQNVWIAGDYYTLYTTNGGGAWQSVYMNSEAAYNTGFRAITLSDLYNGWLGSAYGAVLRTFSGGKHP